jgi:hypothetical protein
MSSYTPPHTPRRGTTIVERGVSPKGHNSPIWDTFSEGDPEAAASGINPMVLEFETEDVMSFQTPLRDIEQLSESPITFNGHFGTFEPSSDSSSLSASDILQEIVIMNHALEYDHASARRRLIFDWAIETEEYMTMHRFLVSGPEPEAEPEVAELDMPEPEVAELDMPEPEVAELDTPYLEMEPETEPEMAEPDAEQDCA